MQNARVPTATINSPDGNGHMHDLRELLLLDRMNTIHLSVSVQAHQEAQARIRPYSQEPVPHP